jgi:cell division protein FtsL
MKRNFSLKVSLTITICLTLVTVILILFTLVSNGLDGPNRTLIINSVRVEGPAGKPVVVQPKIVKTGDSYQTRVDLARNGINRQIIINIPITTSQNTGRNLGIALLFVAAVGLITITLITRHCVSALNQLVYQAQQLSKGYLNQPIYVESSGEVWVLAQVLDNMRLQFRQLMSGAVSKAMVWEGKLEFLALSQLLTILRVTKRTGAILLQGPDQVGVVYIERGDIVGARYRNLSGDAAFWVMFRWENGNFKFNREMKVTQDNMSPWYPLMLEGARRVSSLRLIEGYIPSMDFQAETSPYIRQYQERVEFLLPNEKELLYLVDGNHSVRSLAEKLEWTPEKVQRYLYRLAVIGLVECEYLPQEEPNDRQRKVVDIWKHRARER